MIFTGKDIEKLIPQRAPIMMVDTLYEADDQGASTGLTILPDNMFMEGDKMSEPGIIEHIAQSASAFAGYKSYKNDKPAPIGFIGEIKKFKLNKLPDVGTSLKTSIRIISEALSVSLIAAESRANDEVIASCQMKIFINE